MGLLPMDLDILPPSDDRSMAGELLMSISQNEQERAIYRSRKKFQTDMQSNLATAEDVGKTLRSIEIARAMLSDGLPMETIMRYTGLTRHDIEQSCKQD